MAGSNGPFAAGVLCLLIAFLTLPILALKPRKFAVVYTMGSLLIISSFALLHGPLTHLKHILSRERLPFTVAYLGSLIATLYFVIVVTKKHTTHSYIYYHTSYSPYMEEPAHYKWDRA
ncbi:1154_t:CDS:2 [Funneliformis geosporum]|nr:1154_t:CDS:2 [Funneliformis geosporum]